MIRNLISYPKSGRTWLRYIFLQLKVLDSIRFHHDYCEFNDGSCPPLNFDVQRRIDEYAAVDKLVYLKRDPRDVMVSLYHQITGRYGDIFDFKGTISEFIRHDYFGAHNLLAFRQMWAEISRHRQVHRVTYEECHADLTAVVRRLLAYFELSVDESLLRVAIANADFQSMKAVEMSEQFPRHWLRPQNGSPKVRRGKAGGYMDVLSDSDVEFLNQVFEIRRSNQFSAAPGRESDGNAAA